MSITLKAPFLTLRRASLLTLTSALVSVGSPAILNAQNCVLIQGTLDGECTHANAGTTTAVPTQPNSELEDIPELGVEGFEISVDGDPVAQDGTIQTSNAARKSINAEKRIQDIELASNDVSIKFDGLDVRPRLNVETIGTKTTYIAGETVIFENRMNYPAFIKRAELRILEEADRGGAKTLAVVPMEPNSEISVTLPEGEGLTYVYRVYDARGRYDETAPASLVAPSRRGAVKGVEEGIDSTENRNIPVYGGAVTVSGRDMRRGSLVRTLGETVRPDEQGRFVIQRILPAGDHLVGVDVAGGPSLQRDIEIPTNDLFYIGLIDLTLGRRTDEQLDVTGEPYDKTYQEGRIAGYATGKIKNGWNLTAAVDTGYDDLGDLLKNFDEKNPRSFLDRIDPSDAYPVYGDDSTSEITAPTSGKLFLKVEKNGSHAMWGNFKSEIKGTEYLRNERTLYGAQGVYRSEKQTSNGDAVLEAQVFAAQPDTLPQRDVFLGTGGTSYFLKFQDISRGSETILIEIQDPDTGQVIDRETLVYGVDYDINYVQGLIVLRRPLSGNAAGSGLVVTNPNGDNRAYLVANYEHTPTAADVDALSFGGRVQAWANDKWRIGASILDEDLGISEQKSYGFDVLYQHSEQTYAEFEVARTDGTGSSQDVSLDGGLTFDGTEVGAVGDGSAVRFNGQADLRDLGANINGLIGGYVEDRGAGFSTLNYRSTVGEQLWGVFAELDVNDRTTLFAFYDDFEDGNGKSLSEGGIAVAWKPSEAVTYELGAEFLDKVTPGDLDETGKRTDAAIRVSYEPSDIYSVYAYGQATISHSGGLEKNNRIGLGGQYQLNDRWSLGGEISDGSTGFGARAIATYDRDENSSAYFGWTLDPDRDFGGVTLSGRDKGQFVAGARRKLNDSLTVFGENTYDLFGEHKSLTSTYGADFALNDYLTFTGGLEVGRVDDDISGNDFDRTAVSFGSQYKDDALTMAARLEFRKDKEVTSGTNRDADTIAAKLTAKYKLSEDSRLLFAAEVVKSENASASIPDADYGELTFGYAYRPIDNDRLNVLAKYQYIHDVTERVAARPASGANFETTPRQKAHILSLDASYDLNENWTLGGKVGGRWSDQDNGSGFVSNNATLGIINARFHVVHNWDALVEARVLKAEDLGTDTGMMAAVYRHVGNNAKIGVGYNFGEFSDDLSDVTYNDKGVFLNIIAKF